MIYHAGYGEETHGATRDIWSLFYPAQEMPGGAIPTSDGKNFDGATIVPSLEWNADALGVICHEYGHHLGLPDLYDTSASGGRSTVGSWDLMDYPYTGVPVGSNPPHLGAWSKRFLGFGAVTAVSSGTVSLTPSETTAAGALEIFRAGSESFLLEYRRASAGTYDQGLPQSAGLAVWHVDDNVVNDFVTTGNNVVNSPNGRGHVGVDLVEADGTAANPNAGDLGRGNGFVDGQTLAAPQSNLFPGTVTGLVMTAIQGVGGAAVTAEVLFLGAAPTQSVARAISYPNPSTGLSRPGAPVGTWSTLRIQLARPVAPAALKATLFTLQGVRVRSVSGDAFTFRQDLSKDFEWVYEWDWNGRDESGEDAASGVYSLLFEADGDKVRKSILVQR
jgi:hypothetical protein